MEDILQAIIEGGDPSRLQPPTSRAEVLLQAILDKDRENGQTLNALSGEVAELQNNGVDSTAREGIATLTTQVAAKSDKTETYTKNEVDTEISDAIAPVTTQLAEITADARLTIASVIVNGVFNGLSGWGGNAVAGDIVSDYQGMDTALKLTSSKYAQQAVTIPIGHQFFVAARVFIESYGSGTIRVGVSKSVGGGANYQGTGLDYERIGAWQTVFGIFTNADSDTTLAPFVQLYQGSGTTVAFADFVLCDLTAIFGAGNELTPYRFNCLLSLFPRGYVTGTESALVSDAMKSLEYPVVRYVSTTGSDLNDGKTSATPFLSFQAAINVGANVIMAEAGIYAGQKVVVDGLASLEIKTLSKTYSKTDLIRPQAVISNAVDVALAYDSGSGLYHSAYVAGTTTNYYKVFVAKSLTVTRANLRSTSYNAILWEITGDMDADVKLVPVLTLAECQSTAGSFFYDGTYIYVHPTGDSVDGKMYKRMYHEEGSLVSISNVRKLCIEDLSVQFPAAQGLYLYRCNAATVRRVDSGYSAYSTGQELWQANANCYQCKSYKNCADGFAPVNDGDCNYYDCKGYYNYDDGLSHHYNCTGCIVGGEYHHNVKGGIAPAHGAEVDVYNIISHHNGYGAYVRADADTNVGKTVRHVGNVYYSNNEGMSVLNYHVLSFGCKYTDNTTPTALAATNSDTSLTEL